MDAKDRNELLRILIKDYIYYKEQSKVFQREEPSNYYIALGKLNGFCMALDLDIGEDNTSVWIETREQKKVIVKVLK